MIHTDCISLIGNSHRTCQDYAYADEDMIIVADGCSSSKDSDIGARIWTHCAKKILREWGTLEGEDGFLSYNKLAFEMMKMGADIANNMGLNYSVLDSTLIAAVRDKGMPDRVQVYAYGDGTIVLTGPDGCIHNVIDIHFTSGAPYYLSYLIDIRRERGYMHEFGWGKKIITESELFCGASFVDVSDQGKKVECDFDTPFTYTIDKLQPGSSLAIFTDGIGSFVSEDGAVAAAKKWLINDFMHFKNYNGDFVKRRVAKVIKEQVAKGMGHYDDFSMAAMVIRPDEEIEDLLAKKEELAGV